MVRRGWLVEMRGTLTAKLLGPVLVTGGACERINAKYGDSGPLCVFTYWPGYAMADYSTD